MSRHESGGGPARRRSGHPRVKKHTKAYVDPGTLEAYETAKRDGYRACLRGISKLDNPMTRVSLSLGWQEGWEAARAEHPV
jgi:ribosome modulation factor